SPEGRSSGRIDPVAVKTVGNAVAEPYQRHRTRIDVGGVEHRKIAAVFASAPYHRQQPAVALDGILAAGDKYRLGDGVADRQQVLPEARAAAVDMHHARQSTRHRQCGVGAGVPAVAADETGAAIVDAGKFAADLVEIDLGEA